VPDSGIERVAENLLRDANDRLRYQQEFSVAGFKTLILINGGAIIALLTYAGHMSGNRSASEFSGALIAYTAGLLTSVLAYLAAYFSQAQFMQDSTIRAYRLLGLEAVSTKSEDDYRRLGNVAVAVAIALCILSLSAFAFGSWSAMFALK
jgi:hypothetical protein